MPLDVPPLRVRRADIEPLSRAILIELASRLGRAVTSLDRAALDRLERWHWPGNVRELENVLHRAMVLGQGDTLELPADFDAGPRDRAAPPDEIVPFDDAVRRVLRDALDASGGRVHGPNGAAARLGLPPTTLQAKLRKLGLTRSSGDL